MADITLTYKGATIAELSESGTKTIETAGKYCEADIGLAYVKPGGGSGELVDAMASGNFPDGDYVFDVTNIGRAFANTSGTFTLTFPNALTMATGYNCQNSTFTSFKAPKLALIKTYAFSANTNLKTVFAPLASLETAAMRGATGLEVAVVGGFGNTNNQFYGCSSLQIVDVSGSTGKLDNTFQTQCGSLEKIILRGDEIVNLYNVTAFASTPFKSGGTGGTIYIPKSLYDHLGDNTAYDYKAATNWSTVDGYGTITWAKIEGSQYETAYADGTPIS